MLQLRYASMQVPPPGQLARRGVFLVIAALCLAVVMTFVAFSVDTGIISLTKTKMQNGTDTAALAGAMEITYAISNAGTDVQDVFEYAKAQATAKAVQVAEMNSVYVDPAQDVVFGRRYRNSPTGDFQFDWNPASNQINCIKVIARRDNPDEEAPDGKVPGLFTGMFREHGSALKTESIAYIEPRDLVVVHDFSRSMNFDSYYTDEVSTPLPLAIIQQNLKMVYDDLAPSGLGNMPYEGVYAWQTKSNTNASATVTYKGTSVDITTNTGIKSVIVYFENSGSQTFNISNNTTKTGTWAGTGSNNNKRINKVDVTILRVGSTSQTWALTNYNYDASAVINAFNMGSYPYSSGSWANYVSFVKTNAALNNYGYRDKYGGNTFVCYVLRSIPSYADCKDLWKTRHYPFHAIKEGHQILCEFLKELGFDDYVGMVSYDNSHRIETKLETNNPAFPAVDITSTPLTNDYDAVNKLMKYKQAAHHSFATNMSGGLKRAIQLIDNHKRMGSRPAILLMTDGNSNTLDSGENGALPQGWSWNALFDYDGNGSADFSTNNVQQTAVLKYVKQAVDKGYTVHAISVGNDADRNLMKAVAWLGNGYWVDVPGGMTALDMEEDLREAFAKIASAVPPARLVNPEE